MLAIINVLTGRIWAWSEPWSAFHHTIIPRFLSTLLLNRYCWWAYFFISSNKAALKSPAQPFHFVNSSQWPWRILFCAVSNKNFVIVLNVETCLIPSMPELWLKSSRKRSEVRYTNRLCINIKQDTNKSQPTRIQICPRKIKVLLVERFPSLNIWLWHEFRIPSTCAWMSAG